MRSKIWFMLLGLTAFSYRTEACLRDRLDERVIQWSPVIVKATLMNQKEPAAGNNRPLAMVESTWKVTQSLQGSLKPDTEITVLSFPSTDPDKPGPVCHDLPAKGKTYLLLLRPVKDCEFAVRRDAAEVKGDPYVIAYRLTDEEATEEAVKDLQQQIEALRKAEAAFSDKDAKFQAETLANALDETEAEHADAALVTLGPKALPAVKEQWEKANAQGKSRLQRVIDELSPPPADTGKRVLPARE